LKNQLIYVQLHGQHCYGPTIQDTLNSSGHIPETLALHGGKCMPRFHCCLSVMILACKLTSSLSHLIRRSVDSSLSSRYHDVARLLRLYTHSISGSLPAGILLFVPNVCRFLSADIICYVLTTDCIRYLPIPIFFHR
jgi:hypothetical protein